MTQRISTVITDLDNTLFDWVAIWHHSFKAMLDQLVESSGIARDVLENDFKLVFQKHGTSEYAFAIEELPSLRKQHPGEDLVQTYAAAIHAYNSARKASLSLYPTVLETLEKLKDHGCIIVGYTESLAYYSNFRLRRLGLDRILDFVYAPPDHELPQGASTHEIRMYPEEQYRLRRTQSRTTPKGELKPNPKVLSDILISIGALPEETIYIGDSLMKDVEMAQSARITDVWAKYGVAQDRSEYELLRKVTHWTAGSVAREKKTTSSDTKPSFILEHSFSEVISLFDFTSFVPQTDDRAKVVLELWKKTIDVQQHFNDLELRIRNYAVTLLVGILGATAFAIKEDLRFSVLGVTLPIAVPLLGAGLIGWLSFYALDRFGYHRLLYGSVQHGRYIEERYGRVFPEMRLTRAIGSASPVKLWRWTIHSAQKIDAFYGLVTVMLLAMMAFMGIARMSGADYNCESTAQSAPLPAPIQRGTKTTDTSLRTPSVRAPAPPAK